MTERPSSAAVRSKTPQGERLHAQVFSPLSAHIMQRGGIFHVTALFGKAALYMVIFQIAGMTAALDFTAPALLAFLLLTQPQTALLRMLAACILHESAHFFAIALTGQKPESLRISAAGLRLTLRQSALCPLPAFACILLAGAAANLSAACLLRTAGAGAAARVQLALGLFNLLPCRCTDGGTLAEAVLRQILLTRNAALIQPLLTALSLLTAAAFGAVLLAAHCRSLPLWGMFCVLTVSAGTRHAKL